MAPDWVTDVWSSLWRRGPLGRTAAGGREVLSVPGGTSVKLFLCTLLECNLAPEQRVLASSFQQRNGVKNFWIDVLEPFPQAKFPYKTHL